MTRKSAQQPGIEAVDGSGVATADVRAAGPVVAKPGSGWLKPARWMTLVGGVGLEWLVRYLGSPIWVRLVIIVATIAVIMMLTAAMNTASLSEAQRRQRTKSLAIAGALFGMVALFYAATIVRLGPNALNRDMNQRPADAKAPAAQAPAAPSKAVPACKAEGKC